MSERSSYISDALVYFGDRQEEVAQALCRHVEPAATAHVVTIAPNVLAVAGFVSESAANTEFQMFAELPPFEHDVSIVINCEGGAMIRVPLQRPREFVVTE